MNTSSVWIRGPVCLAMIFGLLLGPDALAGGKRGGSHPGGGGHPGGGSHPGHASQPPRMSAAHRSNPTPARRAPQASHAKAPAHSTASVARANTATPRVNSGAGRTSSGQVRSAGNSKAAKTASAAGFSANTYRYGSGSNPRRYQAYGYGRGYRNRYSAGQSGYGRSQGNNRAVVSRLRSVHSGLARLPHDYRGHRVKAMHHLSLAIRQLSHRSMSYGTNGSGNNLLAGGLNNGRNGLNNGANRNGRATQHLTQAQSDSRLSQALRTTQGVAMQMGHQGSYSSGQTRARTYVQRAMHEMHTALVTR